MPDGIPRRWTAIIGQDKTRAKCTSIRYQHVLMIIVNSTREIRQPITVTVASETNQSELAAETFSRCKAREK